MNLISSFFVKQKEQRELMEVKFSFLRQLKLTELKYIATEYGVLPSEVTMQTNPRQAYGFAIASSLDISTIKKVVGELK